MKIHIFKAGEQTSSTGSTREFTKEDLSEVLETYDASVHEAPIRIGHEDKSDKTPAWGWVKGIVQSGIDLFAEVDFVPQMEQFVKDKLYKKVSASFYHPDSPVNPHKGKWSLRHVALLGAEPPAVKGLLGFAYAEPENEGVEDYINCSEVDIETEENSVFEIMESNPDLGPSLIEEESPMSKLKEELNTVKEEQEQAAQEAPEVQESEPVEGEGEEEFKEAPPSEKKAPSEPDGDEDEDEEEEEFKEDEKAPPFKKKGKKSEPDEDEDEDDYSSEDEKNYAEVQASFWEKKYNESQAKVAELQSELRRSEIEDFIEGIYDSGRLTEEIISEEELLEYMEKIDGGYVNFAEGESPLTPLMNILERLPLAVCFSEVAKDSDFEIEEDFSEEMSPHDKALKIMEDSGMEYTEALKKAIYNQ